MTTLSNLKISDRMRAIESMVLSGDPAADIGTDHGFIPADLLIRGVVPFAVMTDVNEGPLQRCRENMQSLGLDPSLYDIRLGSGFEPLKPGEVSTAVIAGMGGELIRTFFEDAPYDLSCIRRFVIQPRTHQDELRTFLTESGYRMADYMLARERGRICEIFSVEHCNAGEFFPDNMLVSSFLLEKGDPLLAEFIDHKIRKTSEIICSLGKAKKRNDADISIWNAVLCQLEDIRRNI